jgi:carbon-monoxide dehydrogenase small subunit
VTTVEGLATDDGIAALQQAFIDEGAVQCGYCTPGMLMMATALLLENPAPTEEDVREALVGNLCRCTGYAPIVRAVLAAAKPGASRGHASSAPAP